MIMLCMTQAVFLNSIQNINYKYPRPMFKNGFEAVLTSTHNLYFITKTKNDVYAYPCYNIVKLVYIFSNLCSKT